MDASYTKRMSPADGGGRGRGGSVHGEPLPLRPRGVGDLIDAAVELLRGRFLVYLGLAALILAPVRVGSYYAQDWLDQPEEFGGGAVLGFFTATIGLPMLIQSAVTALVIVIVHGQLLARRVRPGEALARTLVRLPALIALLLLMGAILIGGIALPTILALICFPLFPLVFVLVVFLGWKLYLATPALMLEALGPLEAVRRSFQLSSGSFPRWLGVYVVSWLLAVSFGGLSQLADDPGIRAQVLERLGLSRWQFELFYLPISTLLSAVSISFTAVVATTFYLDARMRREGFDLALRLERLRLAHAGA
jgi:hypothetical protein